MTENKYYKDFPIIVMSCDSYSDIWPYFAQCFDRFWPECPFDVYLISELKNFTHPRIKNIRCEKKMRWGEMLLHVIDTLKVPNIIYLQEDYLLRSLVDNKALDRLLEIFNEEAAAYLRLLPWPPPKHNHPKYENIGILLENEDYRTSLQAAIWKTEVLEKVVKPEDDGSYELKSIDRAKKINNVFLSLKSNGISPDINHDGTYPLNYYATSVFQGKWLKEALKIYQQLGINIDTSSRGVMTRLDFALLHNKNAPNSLKYRFLKFLKLVENIFPRTQ